MVLIGASIHMRCPTWSQRRPQRTPSKSNCHPMDYSNSKMIRPTCSWSPRTMTHNSSTIIGWNSSVAACRTISMHWGALSNNKVTKSSTPGTSNPSKEDQLISCVKSPWSPPSPTTTPSRSPPSSTEVSSWRSTSRNQLTPTSIRIISITC